MTTANRLKALRKRLRVSNEERKITSGEPGWETCQQYKDGVKLFREHVGDPADVLGADWDLFFLPWENMIACFPDADMKADFERHQQEDGGASWSFGEFVARDHLAYPC